MVCSAGLCIDFNPRLWNHNLSDIAQMKLSQPSPEQKTSLLAEAKLDPYREKANAFDWLANRHAAGLCVRYLCHDDETWQELDEALPLLDAVNEARKDNP
jgi:hypothetical protein